jgi:O-antigen ligase
MAQQVDLSRWVYGPAIGLLAAIVGLTAGLQPELAIAASFAVGFVIVVIADITWGLVVFTFLAFLEIVPFGGPALSFSKLLGGLLFVSWLAVMTTGQRISVDRRIVRWSVGLLAGLIAWTLLSATWAEVPGVSISVAFRYALNAVLFIIVLTAITDRRDVMRLIGAYVAGAGIAALYGIAAPGRYEADFGRLESAALDPNQLAALLVPALIICVFAAIGLRRQPAIRLVAVGIGTICGLTILLTVSRGGLIAAVVALIAGSLVAGRWRWRMLLVATTVAASGFIYFAGFASDAAVSHLQSTTQGDARVQEGRVTIWQVAWRMAEQNAVIGVGGGNFSESSRHYLLQPGSAPRSDLIIDAPAVVHNTYLETLTELGAIGLGLFTGLIALCLGSLWRAAGLFRRLADAEMELLSRALLAGLTGILVASFFISNEYAKSLWLLLSLGPTMLAVAQRQAAKAGVDSGPRGGPAH